MAQLPAPKVPRYQRFHLLGDGNDIHFDVGSSTPMIWGSRRVDHELYCPPEMSTLPALALPNILHVSYWESKDVGAFILRTFLRFDDINGGSLLPLKNLTDHPPLNFQMPLSIWNKRRTRFKVLLCLIRICFKHFPERTRIYLKKFQELRSECFSGN